eukprot:356109-Prorocentrum_minimum.AAC.1
MAGNAAMIPRALFTRDVIWLAGCTWGATLMGWAQLLSFHLAGVIGAAAFGALTAAYFSYLAIVLVLDSRAHQLGTPLASLGALLGRSPTPPAKLA